jgi:adenylate cyclase
MATEIERKFLVHKDLLPALTDGQHIVQGYIPTADKTAVRIRIKGQQAWLTIKGANQGASRLEFEYPIPLDDAQQMLTELCTGGAIDKHRYEIVHQGLIWEIDVFAASNAGLIVAEVELENEQQVVNLPAWAAEEVTHDARYYNNQLMQNPVADW